MGYVHERLKKVSEIVAPTTSAAGDRATDMSTTGTSERVQAPDQLPWDPNCTRFPTRKELPKIPGAPKDAAWVWGKDDQLGRLNLLTPARVKAAAAEIKLGEMIRLDLPLHIPETPAFDREPFQHQIKELVEDVVYDDTYTLNTQSGTQWDGFRHFAHLDTKLFYNGTKSTDFHPTDPDPHKCSIHHLSTHGLATRAILLDYRHYHLTTHPDNPYDPYTSHPITLSDLHACARAQGINPLPTSRGGDIQPGDLLLIRSGFVEQYHTLTPAQRRAAARRSHADLCWAGLAQDEDVLTWLHDCYFAAVAGDSPTFECWPPTREGGQGGFMHQELLACWGMMIGEMWDLERLAGRCREVGRWTVFVTSAPAMVFGGVGSHANATAIL
ncbi:hypothetical protein BO86DRAFT_345666 [Aspergillus japonicus CBS 114.51]|uniref:Cyclase n=1 Tax=Aspergillus japonicus CBS 114.51 TaxID=1448312 RepID=A0A8T8WR00_ASPJA|nr:hypothetical protein BO86DRAFT_345666 [Aspergillus japonicus CBS 114.51]RAH78275.1 hypothetical protein BO86DRAFT_345666 [Aspergillus japonicus CBS 114.51]